MSRSEAHWNRGSTEEIMSKTILSVIKSDIIEVTGTSQLCVGQKCGCEAAIHALNNIFQEEHTEGILFVDASNAFNNLNRKAALVNAINLCPPIAKILVNTYRLDPALFIDGEFIMSKEGTTQGDPLAMAMYAIATLPLIHQLDHEATQQIWYADDSSTAGSIPHICSWRDKLEDLGPAYGYLTNPNKSWLVVKEEHLDEATRYFQDTAIKVTAAGGNYLGSAIGSLDFVETYVRKKVMEWESELKVLTSIAKSQPQAAYSALVHGIKNKWSYLFRTTQTISHLLQPIEDILRHHVLTAITGRQAINDEERKLFSLLTKLGSLGIDILPNLADSLNSTSRSVTSD
jgi:hypothetical protein